MLVRMWGERNVYTLGVEMQIESLCKSVRRFLINLKIELLHDPTIPLLGTKPKESESAYNTVTCTPICCSISHNDQVIEWA
jgi:hypothetical protein